MTGVRALFVAYANHLTGQGGVQLCTAEFMASLEAAGFALDVVPVEPDRRFLTRAMRLLVGSPYFRAISAEGRTQVRERAQGAKFVFFNQMNLTGSFRQGELGNVPAIGLSHGCEITDQVHLARLAKTLPLTSNQLRPHPTIALARTLRDEIAARKQLAGTIAISPFDADCERWFGTRKVCWIPRTVAPAPLLRETVCGRFGYVGTLDHAPNLEGLEAVLSEIDRVGESRIRVRVVGGPDRLGRWLAARHGTVEYLGSLSDTALEMEAATWSGFLHPIFCLPRGCSTKLAGAIKWGLPIVTTAQGRRGYEWREGSLIEVESPTEFVSVMQSLNDPAANSEAATDVGRIALTGPTKKMVAAQIAGFLNEVSASDGEGVSL